MYNNKAPTTVVYTTVVTSLMWLFGFKQKLYDSIMNESDIFHSCPPAPTPIPTIWHPPMEKNAFVKAVRSSTICQGTWRSLAHPCTDLGPHCVLWSGSSPLGRRLGVPGKHCFNHPWIREALWKSRFPAEKL